MLRSLVSSFRREGIPTTVLASRGHENYAGPLNSDGVIVTGEDPGKTFEERSPEFDCSFIIAPESHGILQRLTASVPPGTRLLSCPPGSVDLFSDKERANSLVSRSESDLKVPRYMSVGAESKEIHRAAGEVGYPCVVKPPDGAGSEGSSIIRAPSEVPSACAKIKASGFSRALVQEYVRGRHLSATFHAAGSEVTPLAINTQSISPSVSMAYLGGSCPFPLERPEVWDSIRRIAVDNKLEGIMGMDFVLEGEVLYFMEINPRITTSCIGLSKIIKPGLGSIITGEKLRPTLEGYAQWTILPLQRSIRVNDEIVPRLMEVPQVISPPFPFGPFYMKDSSRVLICVWGNDSLELPMMTSEIKERLAGMHVLC